LRQNQVVMGVYINIGNVGFQSVRNGEYVDKSGLISIVNGTLFTERRFSCVSRSRRFGKSVAAKMLNAYYDQSCDSRHLFADLEIASDPTFEKHLNKYPVIFLDLTNFTTRFKDDTIIEHVQKELKDDIHEAYPDIPIKADDDLMAYLIRITDATHQPFIFIIDEWDAICREFKSGTHAMDEYVSWLRRMFKGSNSPQVFAGVYMTGILPIKKYKTELALNNFIEYSMVEPRRMASYFGFTKDEVKALAEKHRMDFDELEKWYDGYQIGDEQSIFNPNSVMQAVDSGRCRSFWASTGAYDAVAHYIQMNYEGLKDDVVQMLAGESCAIDPTGFQNEQLLQATLRGDEEAVARGVDAAHDENTSILSYNDENSLACVLSIAYYYASNNYIIHRELATGKGFADLVLIPRKNVDSPAIIIELKYDKAVDTAIEQIKRRQYPAKVSQYADNLLLVGITYERDTKLHRCCIERVGGTMLNY